MYLCQKVRVYIVDILLTCTGTEFFNGILHSSVLNITRILYTL
jgi:uncharacterized membrane protein YqaE (UPF0057 family)